MKCKSCDCCKLGYFKSSPELYVCTGVKYPFVIKDINNQCTEYPDKRDKEEQNREDAIKYINSQLENGYIDLCFHDEFELDIIKQAMSALVCIEQFKWERDTAIEQLEKLGIGFGEEVKSEDITKVVRCKDCAVPHNKWTGCPKMNGSVTRPDDFCSYGERK